MTKSINYTLMNGDEFEFNLDKDNGTFTIEHLR